MKKQGWLFCFITCILIIEDITEMKTVFFNPAIATFAGGCFWCMEPPFSKLHGVLEVIAGYTGGTGNNPTCQDYSSTGHRESIQIIYDPRIISYGNLLNTFWQQINPTDAEGQFSDRGPQYRSAIFYHNNEQQQQALLSKIALEKSHRFSRPIVTEILKASLFYKAEREHQDYYKKHPWRYAWYRFYSGRDRFLKNVWKKISPKKNECF